MIQLKELRERKGLTQAEVANMLECKDKSTISKWESGVAFPRTELLPRLADLYGVTVDDLLREPDALTQDAEEIA